MCVLGIPALCQESATLAITNITVIDVARGRSVPGQTVLVRGGRIASAGPVRSVKVPASVPTIDADGKFVIPGLWDMHTHGYGGAVFMLHIANGVTGMRMMAASTQNARDLKAGTGVAGRPEPVGNRVAAATGPMLESHPEGPYQTSVVVTNPEDARRAVDEVHRAGLDFLKIHTQMDRQTWQAAMNRARALKMPVAGHVPWPVSAAEASDAGYRTIEHLNNVLITCSSDEAALRRDAASRIPSYEGTSVRTWLRLSDRLVSRFDRAKCEALARRFAKNNTWHVPTLVNNRNVAFGIGFSRTEENPLSRHLPAWLLQWWLDGKEGRDKREKGRVYGQLFERWLEVTAILHQAGVRLMAGTDSGAPGLVFGFTIHEELALLVKAGLSPAEALRTATLNPAEFAGKLSDFGSVQAGKVADFVLLDANPLDNIENTKRIHAVVYDGKLLDRRALDLLLEEQAKAVQNLPDPRRK
jgi:imidazolonepropionase-like amidohydrolase